MYYVLQDENVIKSCFYNRNGINWFILNMRVAMSSNYMKIETNDITKYDGFQLVNIEEYNDRVEMYARIRSENEHAMLLLLQD